MLLVFRVGIVYKLDVLPLYAARTLCLDFQRLICQELHFNAIHTIFFYKASRIQATSSSFPSTQE